jgi:formylglycine-generating enzyme
LSEVAVFRLTAPKHVASKKPNAFGIYDMTGNVAEWCNDSVEGNGLLRIVKGGSYNSTTRPDNQLTIYSRSKEQAEKRSPYIGFRVAWDHKP